MLSEGIQTRDPSPGCTIVRVPYNFSPEISVHHQLFLIKHISASKR